MAPTIPLASMATAPPLPKPELSENIESYYQKFRLQLERYLYSLIDDPLTCEDLVQDVFTDLVLNHHKRKIENMKAYLYQAVRFKAARFYRDKYRKEYFEKSYVRPSMSCNGTEELLNAKELQVRYEQALSGLPGKCRQIFSMSRQEDYSLLEIADTLQLSLQTVKNQNSKALRHMRRLLY